MDRGGQTQSIDKLCVRSRILETRAGYENQMGYLPWRQTGLLKDLAPSRFCQGN
jgi:hypothetical protein